MTTPDQRPFGVLLDDFSRANGVSSRGTRWMAFTDRVMGGMSEQEVSVDTIDGRRALRLRGRVRLERNGGFIQVALPLAESGTLDASACDGVRLLVVGNGEPYAIHLRTSAARLPWQYYEARFEAGTRWTAVDVPFTAFTGRGLDEPLDRARLTRVAVVASRRAFDADVAVARIEFYAG